VFQNISKYQQRITILLKKAKLSCMASSDQIQFRSYVYVLIIQMPKE